MNNQQYKNTFLKSEIHKALTQANARLLAGLPVEADHFLTRALAYARQLPSNTDRIIQRAYIVQAKEAFNG